MRFGEVYDWADGVPGVVAGGVGEAVVLFRGFEVGRQWCGAVCVCEGVSCRGAVMPVGKRSEEAW